jgi:hypothetical protein
LIVNALALAYGVMAMIILARPGDSTLGFLDRWIVLLGLALVLVTGLIYLVAKKPYRHSDAPEGDAKEVAAALLATRDARPDPQPNDPVIR